MAYNAEEYALDCDNSEDLSYADLETFPEWLSQRASTLQSLQLQHNQLSALPPCIATFRNLLSLDLSNNRLSFLPPELTRLAQLRTLVARNNRLDDDSLPKQLAGLQCLRVLNLSANRFHRLPLQVTQLSSLTCLYFGANRLTELPPQVAHMTSLQVLYLGGNRLESIPDEVGGMSSLQSLVLCDNRLQVLPNTLCNLANLESLSLHSNQLATLPPKIIHLKLVELSLRNNPLVRKFVEDLSYEPPSLLELAGRVVKVAKLPYGPHELPRSLFTYLETAQHCVNPKCKGVYFSSKVENINFVDFCGKYRLPLLEYLCSPTCKNVPLCAASSSESESEDEALPMQAKMKKVLLG